MEVTGGDYVKVAVAPAGATNAASSLPPIPGQFLLAYAPVPPPSFTAHSLANGRFTLDWTSYQGQGVLQQSTDLKTWTAVPGNPIRWWSPPARRSRWCSIA